MSRLEQMQALMMRAIDFGPDHVPDALFSGPRVRIFAGLKVHANTISHARLVALEETFPRTLVLMARDQFNDRSRLYLEQPGVAALPLSQIGRDFPAFLASLGENPGAIDLARFEWTWLTAYHAAEARPLRLADLAATAPEALLDVEVQAHPAASLDCYDAAVHQLIGLEVPDLQKADAILITRPEAEVLVSPASFDMQGLFTGSGNSITIGNLLGNTNEPDCKDRREPGDQMAALVALLEAGALMVSKT